MKPILFNTEMVKAILEDRKMVTRRVVKFFGKRNPNWTGYIKDGLTLYNGNNEPCNLPAPYKVNDILYVRETWTDWSCAECEGECVADNGNGSCSGAKWLYKANGVEINKCWKPSIHMPKEAARLFLRVKSVCLERLQDIDDKGAYMEGAGEPNTIYQLGARVCEFVKIWNSTIKPSQFNTYGWDANPFVWVIEFERLPCSSIEEAEQLEQVQQLHRQTSFDEDVIGCYKSNYMKEGICEAAKSGWCKDLTKCQILEKVESGKGEGCVAGEML